MVTGKINCGICGYKIEVMADCDDGQTVKLKIQSECPNYQKIAAELTEVDAYQELFQPLHLGQVYKVFDKDIPHRSCPGLSGVLKTIEVASGLALPQKINMEIDNI